MITIVYVCGCLCMWCFDFVLFVGIWCLLNVCVVGFGLCDSFCLVLGGVWLFTYG